VGRHKGKGLKNDLSRERHILPKKATSNPNPRKYGVEIPLKEPQSRENLKKPDGVIKHGPTAAWANATAKWKSGSLTGHPVHKPNGGKNQETEEKKFTAHCHVVGGRNRKNRWGLKKSCRGKKKEHSTVARRQRVVVVLSVLQKNKTGRVTLYKNRTKEEKKWDISFEGGASVKEKADRTV